MFPVVNVISVSALHQQLLKSLPIAHVTEITCYLSDRYSSILRKEI